MLAFALLASCSRPAAPAPSLEAAREAFLIFDNLTGDASLDWIAQAAPRVLNHDLTGVPKTVALLTPTVRDAYLAHADRLVHGYYEMRSGKLHFEVEVEDAAQHRMLHTAAEDGDVLAAMNRAAKGLDAGASAFPAPEDAATAWGRGEYERAVMLDPGFALAWLDWIEQLSTGRDGTQDAARAREVADRALAQPNLGPPIDRARLEMAAAVIRQDETARLAASRKLAELMPDDPALLRGLAEAEMTARRFADAAKDYTKLAQVDPADTSVWNFVGYAEALAGNLEGARKAFLEYGRGPNEAAINSLDSLGEALFINGKFDEAARAFLDAYKKDPAFGQATTLWKAAHARWLGGDLTGADQLAEQFFGVREKAHDALTKWRRANWLYATGRQQLAQDILTRAAGEGSPELAMVAKEQLQVWSSPRALPSDPAELEKMYRNSDPVADGLLRTLYAETLYRAGKTAEAKELVKRWPLPLALDSRLQSLLYPEFLELRKKLQEK